MVKVIILAQLTVIVIYCYSGDTIGATDVIKNYHGATNGMADSVGEISSFAPIESSVLSFAPIESLRRSNIINITPKKSPILSASSIHK